MTYDQIVQGLRDATRELENEGRLVGAGLKAEQDTAGILGRYAWVYSPEALEALGEPSDEAGRRVRSAVLQGIVGRRVAGQDDRLATFYAGAVARVGDDRVPFHTARALLGSEPDARRRELLGDATGALMAEADALALDLHRATRAAVRDLGHDGEIAFWSAVKQVDYGPLLREVRRVAAAAGTRYRAWAEPRMAGFGRAFGACPDAHLPFVRGLREHDAAFAAERFEAAMRRTFDGLGLDLFGARTIHLDLVDRPAKSPRACVWVPEAGREVHLLTRPTGGNADYSAFLHEAGHALHYGLTDPGIGWPLANWGRSMAYAELWSFLFERIGHDPAWIADATGAGSAAAERIATDLAGVDLMMFMRYTGKLTAELELYAADPLDAAHGPRVYAEAGTAATGFAYDPRAWQFDRDPGFYSADYLRAWLAEAALDRWLRAEFGERWWASRAAGGWLREQWRRGSEPEAEEAVAAVGGRPWSGDALLERFQRLLPPQAASAAALPQSGG